VEITGYEIMKILPMGHWILGQSQSAESKSKHLIFTGRVTHRAIGTAISKGARIIISIYPLGSPVDQGDLYAALYQNEIKVYSLGEEWLNGLTARRLMARVLSMEIKFIHSDKSGLRLASSTPRAFLEVISRIGKGGVFWFVDPESMEALTINSVGIERYDADLVLCNNLTQEVLDKARNMKKYLGWIPLSSLLNELSREMMRLFQKETRMPSTFVIEKQRKVVMIG